MRSFMMLLKLMKELGEVEVGEIVSKAVELGIPPPVATHLLMRLVEKGEVEALCTPGGVFYRVRKV